MICRLCLNNIAPATDTIDIFAALGVSLNVAHVLAKYFWFEPKSDDPISTVLCPNCWNQVSSFHEFYQAVERAHRLLTERFSLKAEQEKTEPPDDEGGEGELDQEEEEDLEEEEPEEDREESDQGESHTLGEEESLESFSNEQFLSEVLAQQEQPQPSEPPEAKAATEERRETRSSAKNKTQTAEEPPPPPPEPAESDKMTKKPKRMAGKKVEKPSSKRYPDYKQSMLAIDAKIAAHMRLTCDVCHEGQESFLLLCKHMQQAHHRKGYAVCCNKKFYKRSFLTDHIDRHSDPEKFKCTQCDKRFADKQCLRNHELLKHQPEEEKTFMCEQCPKRYTKQYLLDQHRVIHKERNVVCDICERRFPNQSMLLTHVKLVHGNYGTMCDICAQVIRGRAAFQRHQLEHAGVTEPKVQCDICGSWHKNKHSLKKHVRRHNGTAATCDLCGKVSPNRSAMLSHQRYVHLTDRKHECSVCGKAFKKAISLKEHMTMHTGEVLYKCPHCPKTFNSNANQHTHRRKCHPKEFEETRQARSDKRKATEEDVPSSGILTISTTTDAEGGETHSIVLTQNDAGDLKAEGIEFTLCLSPQAAD